VSLPTPAAFWKGNPRIWPTAVLLWVEGSTPWPRDLAVEDLRWWVDQLRMGRVKRVPGRPTLRRRWSWTDKPVRHLLAEIDPMGTGPAKVQPRSSEGPAAVQPGSRFRAESEASTSTPVQPGSSSGPTRVQLRSSEGPQRVDLQSNRATEQQSDREDTPPGKPAVLSLDLQIERPAVADDWQQLADVYASLPNCGRVQKRDGGTGKAFTRLLNAHGLQLATDVLLWMGYGRCAKINRLREIGHADIGTIARESHIEPYAVHVRRWVKDGRPGWRAPIDPFAPKPDPWATTGPAPIPGRDKPGRPRVNQQRKP